MSFSSDLSGFTDDSEISHLGYNSREVGSYIEARDPSIINPWMRPVPRGTNLYKRLQQVQENTTLQTHDNDNHLKVYLRIKPQHNRVANYEIDSDTSLTTTESRNDCIYRKTYNFTKIFGPRAKQSELFDSIVKNNLNQFIENDRNFCLLTYGTSGSGKTYSLMGTDSQPGIIPRCLEILFARIQVSKHPCLQPGNGNCLNELSDAAMATEINVIQGILKGCKNLSSVTNLDSYKRMSVNLMNKFNSFNTFSKNTDDYEVWVSFAEIYNEQVFDLLRSDVVGPNQKPPCLKVVVPKNEDSYIKNIRWVCVRSGLEAFAILAFGKKRLHFAHTQINSQSSRSHCLFTMKLIKKNTDQDVVVSTFRLCDLAGSERVKKTGNEGARLNESRKINTSLHTLDKCLSAIKDKQNGLFSIPPYRESKLTQLIQNALSGQEDIAMLVNINPEPVMFDETQHVLNFSALAAQISVAVEPKLNPEITYLKSYNESYSEKIEENRTHQEVVYLRERLERLEYDYKLKEKELRREIYQDFKNIKEESERDAQHHLEKVLELTIEKNEFEMENMKEHYTKKFDEMEQKLNEKDELIKFLEANKKADEINHNVSLNRSIEQTCRKRTSELVNTLEGLAKNNYTLEETNKKLAESLEVALSKIEELKLEISKLKADKKNMSIVRDKSVAEEQLASSDSGDDGSNEEDKEILNPGKNFNKCYVRLSKCHLEDMLSKMDVRDTAESTQDSPALCEDEICMNSPAVENCSRNEPCEKEEESENIICLPNQTSQETAADNLKVPIITPFKPLPNENNGPAMSSCRKLFSKRILDEDAACPKAQSARSLFVDENGTAKCSGVTPPSVPNPYAFEKKTRTARKKTKK